MVVWQLWHWNVSKSARSARDLLACMAMPQIGQGRTGRGRSGGAGEAVIILVSLAMPGAGNLIQVKDNRRRRFSARDGSRTDLGQCGGSFAP
jgi:hypothetical protein